MTPPGSAELRKKLRFHSAVYFAESSSVRMDCTGPSPR
jgi:hypothetical protein